MAHKHFCDVGGHQWVCDGRALRPLAGDTEPSVCMCLTCQSPMEMGTHSDCEMELVACPQHVREEEDLIREADEFLRTPEGRYMAELFARRDALADDDPRKGAVVAEILRHAFDCMKNTPPKPGKREG